MRRAVIYVDRGDVHELSKMSRAEILSLLYKKVNEAEYIQRKYFRQMKASDARFVPMRKNVPGYVYFMYAADINLMKIGCSGNPKKRIACNARTAGCKVEIVAVFKSDTMYEHEHEFHELFSCRHSHGEWFYIGLEHLKIAHRYVEKKYPKAA
jgi:hypothetical protein